MKTSARNMFHGSVKTIKQGEVNCEVVIAVGADLEVVSQITPSSLERLGLQQGSDVYALIKASWVILSEDIEAKFKTSARNQYCGTVLQVDAGSVNSDVTLEMQGGHKIPAIVTNESVQELALEKGKRACALVKASHVLLAVAD